MAENSLSLNFERADPDRITLFADVMLPVPIPQHYTYRVPQDWNEQVLVGQRVVVQFGSKKVLTGVIVHLHEQPPQHHEAKLLLEVLDSAPTLLPAQLDLIAWMAQYYMCTPGDVLNAALPSGLKLSSQSKVARHPDFDLGESTFDFSDRELQILEALNNQESLEYNDIVLLLGIKTIMPLLNSLIKKEALVLFEEVREKYRPKTVRYVRLAQHLIEQEGALEGVFAGMKRSPQQENLLLKYLQEVPVYSQPETNQQGMVKAQLLGAVNAPGSMSTLIKKGVLEEFEVTVSRFGAITQAPQALPELTHAQEKAQQQILQLWQEKPVVLLHGITGSGKTEIYIRLIREALDSGSQVLYLLPEIALTYQIVQRLKRVFGNEMGVFHSKFSDAERVEVWQGVQQGVFNLVVGVRSSVFLPFENLGLVIVDEEHENSYKQMEPAPRYHARDVALLMAQRADAKVLLGSATPSIETFHLCRQNRYGYVLLEQRYGTAQLPMIDLANLTEERHKKTIHGNFSSKLLDAMRQAVAQKEQVILFHNRRGYSHYMRCEDCGWIGKCHNCSVSLVHHSYRQELRCHYCGHREKVPLTCPACGSGRLTTVGFGTEKLQEELSILMPEATIERMDLDTTRSKYGYERIIEQFEKGQIDVLIGTQMVSKGLDFEKVSVVGVFDADRMLHFPDFRSFERTFQLITQVSGRAGRRSKAGQVIIQTANVSQPVLQRIMAYDYEGLYYAEVAERQEYKYPPFVRLIKVIFRHADKDTVVNAAVQYTNAVRQNLGAERVLGPQEPMVYKVRKQFIMDCFIKLERGKLNLNAVKEHLWTQRTLLQKNDAFKQVNVLFDVDPY